MMVEITHKNTKSIVYSDYNMFAATNRAKVNKRLNTVLWFCVFTGPAIAAGIKMGVFAYASYRACLMISLAMVIVSFIHLQLINRWPESEYTGLFALFAMEMLLVRMDYAHIHIHMTWFFVPLLSILYCELKIFMIVSGANVLFMLVATWIIAPYYASVSGDYNSPEAYFANAIAGYAIEMIVMFVAGYTITKTSKIYYQRMIEKYQEAQNSIETTNRQMKILSSMSGIYDNVNLLDFENMTETALSGVGEKMQSYDLGEHTHTVMNHALKRKVHSEHFERFQNFTNIRTLQERLSGKKYIYDEFINIITGWFRAQYITVNVNESGLPTLVIYTVQDIEEYKQREESLIRISNTDELTHLYNRRSLDSDIEKLEKKPLEENLVIVSIDVNRLKYVNDTRGHNAGDEMICGVAGCILSSVKNAGKAYRTGGDEFTVIINTDNVEKIIEQIKGRAREWKGELIDGVSVSVGYSKVKDHPGCSIIELLRIADEKMYEDKTRFYKENGYERRGTGR